METRIEKKKSSKRDTFNDEPSRTSDQSGSEGESFSESSRDGNSAGLVLNIFSLVKDKLGIAEKLKTVSSQAEVLLPLAKALAQDQMDRAKRTAVGKGALAYSLGRSIHFATQQLSLPVLEKIFRGRGRDFDAQRLKQMREAYSDLFALLKKDAKNIEEGIYPVQVLEPESAWEHYPRIAKIFRDAFKVSDRRFEKANHDFSEIEKKYFNEVPEYATRNYHFQTGGYFHPESAEIYDHQVEILFSGAADAMRRLILPLLKREIPGNGEGIKILEIAAGTGRLSRMIKLAYPEATLTVSDMSHPYLNQAKKNLMEFDRTEFVRANAESVPFPDGSFDIVVSCFLFHEVPMKAREEILKEGMRLLKPGGLYGVVDSIQHIDTEKYSWALESFPVDFHEPFYTAYVKNPLEESLTAAGFEMVNKDLGFFSKALLGCKRI